MRSVWNKAKYGCSFTIKNKFRIFVGDISKCIFIKYLILLEIYWIINLETRLFYRIVNVIKHFKIDKKKNISVVKITQERFMFYFIFIENSSTIMNIKIGKALKTVIQFQFL